MRSLRYLPRTVLTYAVGFVATLIASFLVISIAHFKPTSPWIDRVARGWSRVWLAAAGVDLQISGEDIDSSRSYVVVANHISNLDIMACFLAVPIPIRYLAKKELFRIPILARAMRAIGIIEVDRSGRAGIHEQINSQAHLLVSTGRSLIIYPEGTRARRGDLASFKKGAFTIAVTTQLPLLPVTIHGAYDAWPPHSFLVRGGPIRVVVDPTVEVAGLTHADTGRLRDTVHDIIEGRLKELAADQS